MASPPFGHSRSTLLPCRLGLVFAEKGLPFWGRVVIVGKNLNSFMKLASKSSLLAVALPFVASAAPFMAIGDGAELFLTGTLGVRSDDNIFLASKAESDLIFDVAPGVSLEFGKNAQLKGALTLTDTFSNYSDNSSLNTQLFSGAFRSNYDDGKLKLGFNLSYSELNQNSVDIRGLTRRDVFNVGGNTEVEISQLTKIGAGVTFNHENYKRRNYTDSDSLEVPLNVFYKWTTWLTLGLTLRTTSSMLAPGVNSHPSSRGVLRSA
jgi:hypothetical protein